MSSMPLARQQRLVPDPEKVAPISCATHDGAARLVRWLGSDEAQQASADRRLRVSLAVRDWMAEREEYVRHVEDGAARLLVQAAERAGAPNFGQASANFGLTPNESKT